MACCLMALSHYLNMLKSTGSCDINFRAIIQISVTEMCFKTILFKLQLFPQMISQNWFRYWLGAVRQQAITWANFDQDLCLHKTSLGHKELIYGLLHTSGTITVVCTSAFKSPSLSAPLPQGNHTLDAQGPILPT